MAISRALRQIILMGVICFGTIGMFNAMSSIGNAGKHSPTAQNLAITSSSIAYIIGFLLAGGTHNMIGPRLCVAFGGLTFFLYAGSMLLAKDDDNSVYPPLAGILLGLGAGCIYVTEGAMMMSYPTEDNKGKYIACFWAIFNLGAVLGSVLPLIMNSAPGMDPDDVSSTTYIVYMVIMGLATFLAVFLVRPSTIIRDNGEPVSVAKFAGLRAECIAILSVFCDWRMLLLIPAFFFSNFSYTYQFNDFNGFNFNIRTRSLNSILFWVAQIIGAIVIGYLLDGIPVKRPRRAMLGLLVIGLLFMATWVAALMVQLQHKWERKVFRKNELIDYEHGSTYTGLLAIYAMFGFCDAAFAVYCYWLMGALSNKHDELSRYTGFFKSIQSLGSAVAAPLDLAQTPLLAYLVTNWILCALSLAAMFLVCRTITDTTIEHAEDNEGLGCGEIEGEREGDDGEMDGADSYYDASVNGGGGITAVSAAGQVSRGRFNSFEGDLSTLCAGSDAEKAGRGLRSNRQPTQPQPTQPQPSVLAPSIPAPSHAATQVQPDLYLHTSSQGSSSGMWLPTPTATFTGSVGSYSSIPLHAPYPGFFQFQPNGSAVTTIQEGSIPAESTVGHGQLHLQELPGPTPQSSRTIRYDDDQDMDSVDTHSISSMSSGHDSIPEMTEMSGAEAPRSRLR